MTQRAYLNAISSFLDYGSRIAVSFVVTPLLVTGLGSMLFGIWQILKRLVGYMAGVDGRPTQALKWVIANHQATTDEDIKRRAVGSALGVWLLMLPLLITLGIGLIWVVPMLTNTPSDLVPVIRITCALLVFNLILSGFILIPEAVLRGMNLGYKRMGLVAGLNILGGVFTVLTIYLEWGLIGIAIAQITITIITGILFWSLVKSFVPWFGVTRVSFIEIRTFLKLSIWYAGWNFVNKLLVASDVIILGYVLAASTVTTYVLTGYIAQMLLTIITIAVGAILPGFGKLIQQKEYTKVSDLRNEMFLISSLIASIIGSMILLWNHSFVTLWVGGEHYAGDFVNLLLVLIAVQFLFIRHDTYLIDLTLDIKQKVLVGTLSALLSIGLSFLLIPTLGIIGLCISLLIGRVILTISYPIIISSFLGTPATTQIRVLTRPLLVMATLFALTSYISQQLLAPTWLALTIYACLTLIPLALIQFTIGLSRKQRQHMIQRVIRLKPLTLDA